MGLTPILTLEGDNLATRAPDFLFFGVNERLSEVVDEC